MSVNYLLANSQPLSVLTMSMGAYDEEEHERRERKNAEVDLSEDDTRTNYEGKIEFDSGDDPEKLLDQFKQMKST